MATLHSHVVCLALMIAGIVADPVPTPSPQVDLTASAKTLVQDIRDLTARAKSGMNLDVILQEVLKLQAKATDFAQQLPGNVSECQTNLVIKMAATATGSHEVLTVLLASDPWRVLSGRLSLSLAFLENVAQQLEDEIILSDEISGHLMAVVFGTNTTASIIKTADETVKAMHLAPSHRDSSDSSNSRIRRQLLNWDLGNGWNFGLFSGLSWRDRTDTYKFNIRPTFRGIEPHGFSASFRIRF